MNRNGLSARLWVALFGVPLLLGLTYAGGVWFGVFLAAITVGSLVEYYRLFKPLGYAPLETIGIALGLVVLAGWYWLPAYFDLMLPLVFLTAATAGIFGHRSHRDVAITVTGVVYVPLLLGAFHIIRDGVGVGDYDWNPAFDGKWLAWCVWGAIWIGDTAAYGIGKNFGKRKLAPKVSPNKTVEGFIAGLIGAVAFTTIWWLLGLARWDTALVVGLTAGTAGQMGDLIESKLKREAGVKDSSNLLPGHGGVLDRFDSLYATVPIVALYLILRGVRL